MKTIYIVEYYSKNDPHWTQLIVGRRAFLSLEDAERYAEELDAGFFWVTTLELVSSEEHGNPVSDWGYHSAKEPKN